MPLQRKDINQKIATNKMQSFGCKNGLVLTIEPTQKGGKKYFYGRMRFASKQIQLRLGKAGREKGEYSLETAMNEW